MQFKHKSTQKGFSLVELAIVLLIMGIMAAIAIPMFTAGPDKRLKAAARNLWADIRFVRMEAVKRRADIGIQFSVANNNYLIFLDDGTGGGVAGNGIMDGTEGQGAAGTPNMPIKTTSMPQDVSIPILGVNFAGGVTSVGYNSRALPNGVMTGNVQLQSIPRPTRCYQLVLSQSGSFQIQSTNNCTSGAPTWSEN